MKAILVIDISEEAYEEISKSEVYQMCVDIGYDYSGHGYSFYRPKKVLSLKPLPQKKDIEVNEIKDLMHTGYSIENIASLGWNACIKRIIS